jgi:hypothetical protein
MADLPHTGQAEWEGSQSSPWITQNNLNRTFDAFCVAINIVRVESDPPIDCVDGDCFLIEAVASGDWAGEEGGIAVAKGADAVNGWVIIPAASIEREGNTIYNVDTGALSRFVDGAWIVESGGGGSSVIHTDADDYTMLDAHVGKYIRLTGVAAKQVIIQDEQDEPLTENGEWHIRNVGAGDAEIVPSIYTVVNLPPGGTYVIESGGTVTLKRVAYNEFDLMGLVASA